MAGLINRRAQAAAEQEAMSRRGGSGFRGTNRSLFSTDQADEFGRTSIFSKSPEKDPNFDPSKNEGNPYKENTKAGKRLNLRELQNRIAEAEGMRMLQKQHELSMASDNNRSNNTINEGKALTENELKKIKDVKALERVAETERAMQIGRSRNPNASDTEALHEGIRVQNTASMSAEDKRQAEAPHLPGMVASKANVTNRENDSKDSNYFKESNAANIAKTKAEAFKPLTAFGNADFNTAIDGKDPTLYAGGNTKVINEKTNSYVDKDNNLVPGSERQILQQTDPKKLSAPPKINLGAYDPNATPDLGAGNSERASAGGNTSTQTTNSNPQPAPQIAPIQQGPEQGSWSEMFNRNNATLEGSVGLNPVALTKAPVIPSLQAPAIQPPASGSMEPSTPFVNPFEAPKANPFGIPAPQQNWDPNGPKSPMEDPVYGNMNSQALPNMPQVPKAPNHMIPQIGNPLPQGAKPQSQLNVPDLLNLIRSYMSKPQAPSPAGFNRPGF